MKKILFLICFLISFALKSQTLPGVKVPIGNAPGDTAVLYNQTVFDYLKRVILLKGNSATSKGKFWGFNRGGTGTQIIPVIRDSIYGAAGSSIYFKQDNQNPTYGANLVTNGTFTGGLTGWTSTGWTASANTALHTPGNTNALSQSISGTVITAPYQLTVTVSGRTAGSFTVSLGGYTSAAISANGTSVIPLHNTLSGTQTLAFTPTSTFDGALDGVELRIFVAAIPVAVFGTTAEMRPTAAGFFMGLNSGRFATGGGNFGNGDNALSMLTSGINNTATAQGALEKLTIGIDNTATSFFALRNLKDGSYNTATGDFAGYSNVSGNLNDYDGSNSGYFHTGDNACLKGAFSGNSLTTFTAPTFYGSLSGRRMRTGNNGIIVGNDGAGVIADLVTHFTNATNFIYIGDNTAASANGVTNEYVFGHNMVGQGANTQVYGNGSMVSTYLMGKIAIGIGYTPTAKLHLPAGLSTAGNAALKLTSGSDLSVPEAGAFSYNGTEIKFANTAAATAGRVELIARVLKNSATIDFASTSAASSADATVTVTGAAVGDVVSVGLPASPDANSCFTGWVSATNTVTIRFNNYSVSPIDPASGTYNVIVTKY